MISLKRGIKEADMDACGLLKNVEFLELDKIKIMKIISKNRLYQYLIYGLCLVFKKIIYK